MIGTLQIYNSFLSYWVLLKRCPMLPAPSPPITGERERGASHRHMDTNVQITMRSWPLIAALALIALTSSTPAADRIDFSRDIQPILADKCYHCHGFDVAERKANLRLDTHEGAFLPNKDGVAAIVPGNLQKSELVRRISSKDPDDVMPPPKAMRQLTAAQIELLRNWVQQGAPWGQHWSFVVPARPPLPAVKDNGWCRNPIDHFVLNKLEAEGLHPSPEARKEKLIRRVTLDLTGLPPTLAEVDAFLADHSPGAYEKVVDRLLASPHYGERMALPWLDAARYSDTNGYQADRTRTSWIWRDWVVRAMNENMPFDQFTVEQLAGDLLPESSVPQKVATGFDRMHMLNGEGGSIAEESRNNYVIDRVNTTSTVWLGLTLGCCQCHDHKYDPFTQKEYYQLFAYFNNVSEVGNVDAKGNAFPVMKVSTPEQEQELAAIKKKASDAEKALKSALPKIDTEEVAWEKTAASQASPAWTVMVPNSVTSQTGAILTQLEDGSILASGLSPDTDIHTVVVKTDMQNLGGLRLEALPDDSLPHQGPGRSEDTGNFVLTELEGESVSIADLKRSRKIIFGGAEATYSQAGFSPAASIEKPPKGSKAERKGWAIDKAPNKKNLSATFTFADSVSYPGGSEIRLRFHYESKVNKQHVMGHFRVSLASGEFLPAGVASILHLPAERRSATQKQKLIEHFRNTVSREYRKLNAAVVNAKDAVTSFETRIPDVMVMDDAKPRETFIHVRGQYDKFGDRVYPNLPAALYSEGGTGGPPVSSSVQQENHGQAARATAPATRPSSNRLDLARWIVSPQNPLTARVTVNRYWQQFFGTGIVKTAEDFGIQGEKPSHPELLDWLATEFVGRHWDVKAMHRLIVTSAIYRQAPNVSPDLLEKDPENRLLGHGPRYRLSAFALRDQALAVSGLLVDKPGGEPVKPYQPAGIWEEFSFNKIKYEQDHGDALYRRSLYTFWRRTVPPPTMFDTSSRQICTVRQGRTNTPLQSLVLLNEMTYVECSRIMAERVLTDPALTSDAARLAYAFRLCTAREPSDGEKRVLLSSLERLRKQYESDKDAAMKLLSVGEKPRNEKLDVAVLAAYAQVCDLILNLDETLTKE